LPNPRQALDKDGQPWDERIHSRGKTKIKDGTWKVKKMNPEHNKESWVAFIAEVRGESATLVATPAPAIPTPVVPVAPPIPVPAVEVPKPAPAAASIPTLQASGPVATINNMSDLMEATREAGIDNDAINAAAIQCKLNGAMDIFQNPDKCADIAKALGLC
jgi:hypothetical protein